MKTCTKCRIEKEDKEFYKSINKDGLTNFCKICYIERGNKSHIKEPWKRALNLAKQRCTNPKNPKFKWYGERNIEFHLTFDDGEYLWNKYKTYLMKNPSLDRIDNDGDYTRDNCRFMEQPENSCRLKRKVIVQYDLQGNFIREWISQAEIEKQLNISQALISDVCLQKASHYTAGGFKWEFAEV